MDNAAFIETGPHNNAEIQGFPNRTLCGLLDLQCQFAIEFAEIKFGCVDLFCAGNEILRAIVITFNEGLGV